MIHRTFVPASFRLDLRAASSVTDLMNLTSDHCSIPSVIFRTSQTLILHLKPLLFPLLLYFCCFAVTCSHLRVALGICGTSALQALFLSLDSLFYVNRGRMGRLLRRTEEEPDICRAGQLYHQQFMDARS